jgi:hypothetical protein
MLNKPVPSSDILQLIGYRRILMHKYCNPNYVHKYSVQMIASRVIRLTLGCVSKCNELERCLEEPCDIKIVPNPTTTSTSTLAPITTTTSTSSTSTSTTSTSTTAVPTTTTTSSSSTSTTTSTTTAGGSTTTTTTNSGVYSFTVWLLAPGESPCYRPSTTVYSTSPFLAGGIFVYTDSGLTTPVTDGLVLWSDQVQPNQYSGSDIYNNGQIYAFNKVISGGCPTTTTTTTIEPTTTTTSTSSTTTTTTTGFPLSECAIFINDNNGTIVTYDISTNIVTPLLTTVYSRDIANTTTRIWIYDNATAKIAEYTITLSPWTIVFNRYINYPVGVYLGAGLCAVDNTKLITTNQINLVPNTIIEIDITGSTAIVTDTIATLDTDYFISGDIVLSTTGKVICITQSGFIYKLTQYDRITGVKEVDSDISSYYTTEYPLGLIENDSKLYILGSSGSVKEVNLSSPYALTLIQTSTFNTSGASSAPQCSTVNLIPPA